MQRHVIGQARAARQVEHCARQPMNMVKVQPDHAERTEDPRQQRHIARKLEVQPLAGPMRAQADRLASRRLEEQHAGLRRDQRRQVVDVTPHAAAPAVHDEQQRRPAARGQRSRGIHAQDVTLMKDVAGESRNPARRPQGMG